MKLVNTITNMVKNYPTLFTNRESCLNQLFLVIGNGYKWKNGQLVDDYERRPLRVLQDFDTEFEIWRNSREVRDIVAIRTSAYEFRIEHGVDEGLGSLEDYLREGFRRDYDLRAWGLANARAIAKGEPYPPAPAQRARLMDESQEPYPLAPGYSEALCIPDDVQQDWLEGAIDALKWARDVPITSYIARNRGDGEVQQRYDRNQTHAIAGLLAIEERFGFV